ncbi:hypothetical protein ADL29_12140 [Streptomyces chattanoogensis]|uniref:Uncharacterized protein n=1 Tax=Streptomyces chattanoogensis TaxID=66876 RepID=A0A0N0XYQ5_9ACTN|nr:hypothetical protein ADL29_12140 [Streptomyces chattanoogensis]
MLQRGDPGHVLVQDVMLPLLGRQGPQVFDGGVEVAGRPEHGGIEDWLCHLRGESFRGDLEGRFEVTSGVV